MSDGRKGSRRAGLSVAGGVCFAANERGASAAEAFIALHAEGGFGHEFETLRRNCDSAPFAAAIRPLRHALQRRADRGKLRFQLSSSVQRHLLLLIAAMDMGSMTQP